MGVLCPMARAGGVSPYTGLKRELWLKLMVPAKPEACSLVQSRSERYAAMPYRYDGFSWPSDDPARAIRIIAAVALITGGWAIGFFSGRMSAWVFPVANPNAALKSEVKEPAPQPTGTTESPSEAAKASPTDEKQRPTLALSPGAVHGDPSSTERSDTAKSPAPQTKPPEQTEAQTKPPPREAVLVNPEWTATRRMEPEANPVERDRGGDVGIAECERRYSSFRASDGTYQPFDGGPRVRCRFLR
jgi:hypothetical protein